MSACFAFGQSPNWIQLGSCPSSSFSSHSPHSLGTAWKSCVPSRSFRCQKRSPVRTKTETATSLVHTLQPPRPEEELGTGVIPAPYQNSKPHGTSHKSHSEHCTPIPTAHRHSTSPGPLGLPVSPHTPQAHTSLALNTRPEWVRPQQGRLVQLWSSPAAQVGRPRLRQALLDSLTPSISQVVE